MTAIEKTPFWARRLIWLAILVALISWFLDYNSRAPSIFGQSWFDWDPMSFSGFLSVIIGIAYSIWIDRSQEELLSRWHDAAILELDPEKRHAIVTTLAQRSLVGQVILVAALLVVMVIGYANFFENLDLFAEFSLASLICAFLVALRLARLVSHGLIGQLIKEHGVPFGMTIEHPDRTGGTAQIGTFYLLQASVMTIQVLWLLVWMLLIPSIRGYEDWAGHFFYLLLMAVVVFILAFSLPMRAFGRLISDWKNNNVSHAIDQTRKELIRLRAIESPTPDERQKRSEIAQDLHNLIYLPNWPISPVTRNVFVTTFMLPLVVNVVTNAIK